MCKPVDALGFPQATPSPDQPGSLVDQFLTISTAIYLGQKRNTSARQEWQDARALVLKHARGEQEGRP